MPDPTPTDDSLYRRSSYSVGGECVEVIVGQDDVKVRHSRHAGQGTLIFTLREWAAFTAGVKAGEFEIP